METSFLLFIIIIRLFLLELYTISNVYFIFSNVFVHIPINGIQSATLILFFQCFSSFFVVCLFVMGLFNVPGTKWRCVCVLFMFWLITWILFSVLIIIIIMMKNSKTHQKHTISLRGYSRKTKLDFFVLFFVWTINQKQILFK